VAPAQEAAYVGTAKKKAPAEAHFGSSGFGAVQSSGTEQPHLEKAASLRRVGHQTGAGGLWNNKPTANPVLSRLRVDSQAVTLAPPREKLVL
jgi:hypothetical protein